MTISQAEKDLNRLAMSVAGIGTGTARQVAGNLAHKVGKTALRQAGKGLMTLLRLIASFLGPYLWIAIAVVLVILLVLCLTMGIFGVMTAGVNSADGPTGLFTGVNESTVDPLVQSEYQKLEEKVNYQDTHLVPADTAPQHSQVLRVPLYPGANSGQKLGEVHSYYQQEQYLPWGTIHAVRLWWAFLKNDNTILDNLNNMKDTGGFEAIEQGIPDEVKATTVAGDLHPYFYYIKDTFSETYYPPPTARDTRPERSSRDVYLLVEQNTIDGWEQYFYKIITETTDYPNGAVVIRTYDKQDGSRSVVPDRYQRVSNYLDKLYGMDPGDPQADLMRLSVMEAGEGFVKHEQHVDWLITGYDPETFVSSGMVPAEYQGYFQEASERFGIPVWFLEAVAMQESGFDPAADNGKSGPDDCYGLMQVSVPNWNEYAPQLGYDLALDKDNPQAQIMVGAYILKSYLGNVDWSSSGWQDRTLVALTWHSGYRNAQGQVDQEAIDRCRTEYASSVWELAAGFENHNNYYWPVNGEHIVITLFNQTDYSKKICRGVVIEAGAGVPVYSVSGGYVQEVGADGSGGSYVIINDTVHTCKYSHLQSVSVQQNQEVEAGATVLGRAWADDPQGSSLQLEIADIARGVLIDPLSVIGYDFTIQ